MSDEVTTPDGPPTPEPTPAATPAERTFTQTELEQHIADRLKREREKYRDYNELKTAAEKLKALEEAQLSEAEKLQKRLAELEQAKTQAETRARDTLIRSAIISEAARLNFNDPADAYRLIDLAALKVTESGEVEGAVEAVKVLAESRKYLLKSNNPALASFNPAGNGSGAAETDAQRRARIYGGGGSMFDAGRAEQSGGGVWWAKGKPDNS